MHTSNIVGDAEHPYGMRHVLAGCLAGAMFELIAGKGAITAVVIGFGRDDFSEHRPADLHGVVVSLSLDGIGAVMPRAAADGLHLRIGNEREQFAGLGADVLHALMTGGVTDHLAAGMLEIGAEQALTVAAH